MDKLKNLIVKKEVKKPLKEYYDVPEAGGLYLVFENDFEPHSFFKINSKKDIKAAMTDNSGGVVGLFKCIKDDKAILGAMKETVADLMSNRPKSEYHDTAENKSFDPLDKSTKIAEEFDSWTCMECHYRSPKRFSRCPKCGSGEVENLG